MDLIYFTLGFMSAFVLISSILSIRTLDREITKYQRKKKKKEDKSSAYQAW
jgi:biopolymer transport protein ExbB/TolQ